jgi:hypothetical protein
MYTEPAGSRTFSIDLSRCPVVGFHATCAAASDQIETVGFLPNKFFDDETHHSLLDVANELHMPTSDQGGYRTWLQAKSVSFTKKFEVAVAHADSGNAGGQGLAHIAAIVDLARSLPKHRPLIRRVERTIRRIQQSNRVVYAVDLSNFGDRLAVSADGQFCDIYYPADQPLPAISIVDPARLLARLNL